MRLGEQFTFTESPRSQDHVRELDFAAPGRERALLVFWQPASPRDGLKNSFAQQPEAALGGTLEIKGKGHSLRGAAIVV